jgi:hypothetical protein
MISFRIFLITPLIGSVHGLMFAHRPKLDQAPSDKRNAELLWHEPDSSGRYVKQSKITKDTRWENDFWGDWLEQRLHENYFHHSPVAEGSAATPSCVGSESAAASDQETPSSDSSFSVSPDDKSAGPQAFPDPRSSSAALPDKKSHNGDIEMKEFPSSPTK